MKFLVCIFSFFIFSGLYANQVEITSTIMKAENMKKEIHFIGNAKLQKDKDRLEADKVVVYFNDQNKTHMYEAIGKVRFDIYNNKTHYRGRAEKIIYHTLKLIYELEGKVVVEDVTNKSRINGDTIYLDMKHNDIRVTGTTKKPVKFIFDVKDKKQ